MMYNLSKSKYTLGTTCEKKLWLSVYKPEEEEKLENEEVLQNGNRIGELARYLFGDFNLIDFNKGFESMIKDTKELLNEKPNIICEASFSFDGNFCSIDILKNDIDGVEIYEVKSSTEIKNIYIDDLSYQTWVLKKCGLNVKRSCLVYVNNKYVKHGALDIHDYFSIEDFTNEIDLEEVENNISKYSKLINQDKEPNIDLNINCKNPYDCPFFKYCTKNLETPNIFNVGCGVRFDKKIDLYNKGIISYKDILDDNSLNDKALEQVNFELNNLDAKINKNVIKELLGTFSYPLYFLDFESYQAAIPDIDNTKPYQQICFQYSLHYYLEEGGELYHKEFLNEEYDSNPMYNLSKQLCEDIPKNSCVLVYNQSFEKARLKEMAELFPEFRDHLNNINDNIKDLLPPFRNHDYYVKEMYGSASIKKVLPALFPNDPELDYHNLEQVHVGTEASEAYLALPNLSKNEQEELRKNMLKYCALDTFAMVKIYQKLKEVIK